jgi:hypothetical protein
MATLVDDDVVNAVAVVGGPDEVALELLRRYGDLFSRCSLYTPYEADPALIADIAADIRTLAAKVDGRPTPSSR